MQAFSGDCTKQFRSSGLRWCVQFTLLWTRISTTTLIFVW